MNSTILLVVALGASLASQSVYACDRPSRIDIPDGATVTEPVLRTTDVAVRQYMASMYDYLDCLEFETDVLRQSAQSRDIGAARDRENAHADRHNEAVKEMKETLAEFDKAIEEFKARQSS